MDVVHVVFTCRRDTLLDASSHDHTCRVLPFKQVSNPIRVDVHLEVLVHQLNGFFVFVTRHNTIDSRQQCSCCQRSATMFAVFLHCTAVLNCVRATHGLLADRTTVFRGCPCRDPLGCSLIPRQNGIRDKAPTLWLLQLLRLLQLLHVCACDQHWTCFHQHTPRSNVRDVDFDRFGLYCDAPHTFNLNL